jgi:hypothetical protein
MNFLIDSTSISLDWGLKEEFSINKSQIYKGYTSKKFSLILNLIMIKE